MPTNGEKISKTYDLYDTVAYVITAPTVQDEISYQTPFGWHYDYYTSSTKSEIKVRTSNYNELEIPFTKVAEMLLERYNDRKKGLLNLKYIFQCPIVPENKIYTVDLDTVLECEYNSYERPKSTVDGKKEWITKLEYRIPIDKWSVADCDCSKYDEYIKKGKIKYNIE